MRPCIGGVELNRFGRLRGDLLRRLWRLIEAEHPSNDGEVGQLAACPRVQGIERNRLAQQFFRRAEGFVAPLRPHHALGAQNKVVSPNFVGALAGGRLGLVNVDDTKIAGDFGDDLTDDLVLDEEDVGHLAIETISPNVAAGLSIAELCRDAEVVASTPDTALEHVSCPQLTSNFGDIHGLTLVLKGGVAREHAEVA